MSKNNGGGSKLLTGILCFLLGFIIAFCAVAGVLYMGVFGDINTIFKIAKIDNTDDEGNYVYINTDEESGGVSSLYALLTTLVNYVGDYSNMTIGDLENLIPATSVIADSIVSFAVDYVSVDSETLRNDIVTTKIGELGTYVSGLVSDLEAAPLLEQFVPDLFGDDATGVIITALVYGKEADYVYNDDSGANMPVYYDVYKPVSGGYRRYTADENGEYTVADSSAAITDGDELCSYLVPVYSESDDEDSSASTVSYMLTASAASENQTIEYYYLYYYLSGNTACVTDGDFSYIQPSVTYSAYSEDTAALSGNYYVDENGDRVVVTAITLGDLSDSQNITDNLSYVSITDLIDSDGGDSLTAILGDYTIGDLISGNVDFDTIALTSVLSTTPSNTAMLVILYKNISGIKQSEGNWVCTYTDENGDDHDCTIILTESGNVSRIVYYVGEELYEVPENTIGEVSEVVSSLELVSIMDPVAPDDDLMMYVFYGVTGITSATSNDYNYTASYKLDDGSTVTAYIVTDGSGDDETVKSVYYLDGEGNKVSTATNINNVSDVINSLQEEFEIAALMGDVDVEDSIMVYISYKITGVYSTTDENGNINGWYGYVTLDGETEKTPVTIQYDTVTETVTDGTETTTTTTYYITGATYEDAGGATVQLGGTTIDGISDVISGLQEELEIASLLGDVDVEDAIMVYISYKITGVYSTTDENGNVNGWYGYVTLDGATQKTLVTIQYDTVTETAEDGTVTTTYYMTGATYKDESGATVQLGGTTIDGISDVISDMQDEFEIASFMGDIDVEDDVMVYVAYKVTGAYYDETNKVWYGTYTDADGKHTVILNVKEGTDEDGETVYYVTSVTYKDGSSFTGTTINGISDVINDMQDELEIASFMDNIDVEDSIMVYIAYSIFGVYSTTDGNGNITGWYGYITLEGETDKTRVTIQYDTVTKTAEDGTETTTYYITGATYADGENTVTITGTTINGISGVVSGLQEELEIASLLGDIHTDDDILIYIAYSVTGVYYDSDAKAWCGTYNVRDDSGNKTTYDATLAVEKVPDDEDSYLITGVTYTYKDGEGQTQTATVYGTTINGLNAAVGYIEEDMEIAGLLGDIKLEDNAILIYLAYSIYGVYYDSDEQAWYGYITLDGSTTKTEVTIEYNTDDEGVAYITGATYKDGNGATVHVAGTTIKGISSQIDGVMSELTIGELIDTDGNAFLESLSSSSIEGLSEAIDNLSIQEVYHENIYVDVSYYVVVESDPGDGQVAFDSSDTFYTYDSETSTYEVYNNSNGISSFSDLENSGSVTYYVKMETEAIIKQAVSTVSNSAAEIKFSEDYLYYYIDEDGNYTLVTVNTDYPGKLTSSQFASLGYNVYTYGAVSGTWELMLYSADVEVDSGVILTGEFAYSINNISKLMSNVTTNLDTATLYDLKEMGVITTSKSTLDKVLTGYDATTVNSLASLSGTISTTTVHLGDLSITEVINYVVDVIDKTN